MVWIIGFLILLAALLIPILAIVLDSPALRHFDRFGRSGPKDIEILTHKVATLQEDVDELGRAIELLREETQFLQRLLENPAQRPAQRSLTSPNS